jgi:hypothetical protein
VCVFAAPPDCLVEASECCCSALAAVQAALALAPEPERARLATEPGDGAR